MRHIIGLVVGAAVFGPLQSATAAAPTVTITGTTPGLGAGTITVKWSYANCAGATTVKVEAFDPTTGANVGNGVFPAASPGSGTVQTTVFNGTVNLKVTVLNGNTPLASTTGSGMTR